MARKAKNNPDPAGLLTAIRSLPPKARRSVVHDALAELAESCSRKQLDALIADVAGNGSGKAKPKPKPGTVHPKNKLNDLPGNVWSFFTKTIAQTAYPSEVGHKLRRAHYANKPPALMREIIEFFTKRGQSVLDPFAGVGGTLLAASLAGRTAVGIELEQKWLDIYAQVCDQEGIAPQETVCGDSLDVLAQFAKDGRTFDAIITDPPYSPALEKTLCDGKYGRGNRNSAFDSFSESPRDFRNSATFAEFFDRMERVGRLFHQVLGGGHYAAVIIRDSYQDGEYIPASFHVAERFRKAGFQFKGNRHWYQAGSPVRPYGYPYAYVPNIVHHTILVFRKEP
jgi:DNA modification methylase